MGWDDLANPELCLSPSTHRLRLLRSVRTLSQLARRIYSAKMQPVRLTQDSGSVIQPKPTAVHSASTLAVKPGHYLSNQGRSAPPVTLPHHTIYICNSAFRDPRVKPGDDTRRKHLKDHLYSSTLKRSRHRFT